MADVRPAFAQPVNELGHEFDLPLLLLLGGRTRCGGLWNDSACWRRRCFRRLLGFFRFFITAYLTLCHETLLLAQARSARRIIMQFEPF
jgi:hypothetical protein